MTVELDHLEAILEESAPGTIEPVGSAAARIGITIVLHILTIVVRAGRSGKV